MTTRRLAAILAADVVGFSKLIGEDEAGTLAALREIRKEIVNPILAEHGGRIFKLMGDGLLAEFPSAVQALKAAIAIQEHLHQRNAEPSSGPRIEVRIGIHQGDVVVEGTDLLGDGVNIAARLEALAEAGGICISGRVYEDAAGKIALHAEDMGEQNLKNIARPVRAYRVALGQSSGRDQRIVRPALALPDKPSIAVLPFQNMSGDPEQEYFADGMVEEIITALSRVKTFFVIARNSSFTYKGKTVDIRQVGRELGVHYVLEGSVRKSGGRLRITGQLIEAETGRHIWADKFDGQIADLFELQDSITAQIVSAIEPSIQFEEINRASKKSTESLSAHDYYLRALFELGSHDPKNHLQAENLLRQAIQIDQNYADAFALLALTLGRSVANGWVPVASRSGALDEARAAARRAAQLDNTNPTVLARNALVEAVFEGSYERSDDCAERALRLAPSSAEVRLSCGIAYAYGGACDAAVQNLEAALRLSPLDHQAYVIYSGLSMAHVFARRFEEAEKWARRALAEYPKLVGTRRYLAVALAHSGRIDEARLVIAEVRRLQPESSLSLSRTSNFRHPWQMDIYIDGLRQVGLPE